MPSERFRKAGGRTHSFQIWVNLPTAAKGARPGYQYLPAAEIPVGRSDDGLIEAKVISGTAFGVSGRIGTHTPVVLQDWTVQPGGRGAVALPADHNAALYVFQGAVTTGPEGARVEDGTLAILGAGGRIEVAAAADAGGPARLLLLAGRPIGEPVARYGPFVMTTEDEIHQAIRDYQSGRMGVIRR
jgi:redox-sensitive bicupin YhaK (pirin superfamily)